ncbi:MAG: hypothetical protein V7668_00110 [Cereibacter changlensis]|uniref:5-carboxymethyl-2-hydroxymuconate isomerase n=2 Tax=Cereibacter changlensis TaxID=402884 RepID=A0A2T4JZH9_9RHOB|nr:hypothetical protein [Cereibacter changlensis]PTE23207.1 hypothetical protein C5F48_03110 [Cereibacter changlensis JA139]PZX49077.1 hypothetical protein LX76_03983 [Cereibacter changlensis]
MPNVKLYIDDSRYAEARPRISALLPGLRDMLCARLEVDRAACQLAVLPVLALPDQPGINAELHVLPRASRSRDRLEAVAAELRTLLAQDSGLTVAVRIVTLDAATYVALK